MSGQESGVDTVLVKCPACGLLLGLPARGSVRVKCARCGRTSAIRRKAAPPPAPAAKPPADNVTKIAFGSALLGLIALAMTIAAIAGAGGYSLPGDHPLTQQQKDLITKYTLEYDFHRREGSYYFAAEDAAAIAVIYYAVYDSAHAREWVAKADECRHLGAIQGVRKRSPRDD
jgi:hypothetical protein